MGVGREMQKRAEDRERKKKKAKSKGSEARVTSPGASVPSSVKWGFGFRTSGGPGADKCCSKQRKHSKRGP
jgi:hypothetical protein